ncbi:ribonuclease III [Gammaproteobacteria bacterium]|nr:ribonuclease III [Gammaproteobacteria bacterium]
MTPAERLQHAIGYNFSDFSILSAALRHRSMGSGHNERLEFLGDSILGMVVATVLFERYGDAGEGELTRLRVQLVRQRTLANVARRIDLGAALKLGAGAARSGGADRSSILSDGLEALIAAIFLDSDFSTVQSAIISIFQPELLEIASKAPAKDPKTRLQELLQGEGLTPPAYRVSQTLGQPHRREFVVECEISEMGLLTHGRGASRKSAEQRAATLGIEQLLKDMSQND